MRNFEDPLEEGFFDISLKGRSLEGELGVQFKVSGEGGRGFKELGEGGRSCQESEKRGRGVDEACSLFISALSSRPKPIANRVLDLTVVTSSEDIGYIGD